MDLELKLKEKMIGGINETHTENRISYECLLLLNNEDLSELELAIGDSAPWLAPDSEIRSISKTFLADGNWTLRVVAEVGDKNKIYPTIRLNENELLKTVEASYDVSSIFFPLEWFGCRTATSADCPPFLDSDLRRLPGGRGKYQTLDGAWATPGSILAINGEPMCYSYDTGKLIQSATPGSMDYSKSPFAGQIPAYFIRQTIPTRLYRCCFYTKQEMHKIDGFCGVNGKFGNRCQVRSTKKGRWLAKSQRLKQVTALNGKTYTRVERVMLEAPGDLRWDAERNGGTWSW